MQKIAFILSLLLVLHVTTVSAQETDTDSTLENLQQLPKKYMSNIDKKVTKYSSRITNKTTKTLTKLSRWENKIKGMLEKVSPETAAQLFAPGQTTFTSLLQQVQQGEALALSYQAQYNKYTDDVTTSLKYIAQQKEQLDSGILKRATATHAKMKELASEEDKSEALQQFIKERKKQLISQAIQHIGQSKYLVKMNKEAFYYAETLKNYKEIFSDSKKAEQTAKSILGRIPAFTAFMRKNSMIASLFRMPDENGATASISGLQTRESIQNLIQERIGSAGPNAMQQVRQNIQAAQSQLDQLKSKLSNGGMGNNGGGDLPDFKPNMQKTKTFMQRLEYGFNMQFGRTNSLLPGTADIALSAGYKINDQSVIGIGASYKLGMGTIENIHLSHQGIGLRSFIDWKLPPLFKQMKNGFYISGGYELNYNAGFKNISQLKNYNEWQRSALVGVTKKLNIKTKFFKATNIQMLYDFLSHQHVPVSQPVLFRVGYSL